MNIRTAVAYIHQPIVADCQFAAQSFKHGDFSVACGNLPRDLRIVGIDDVEYAKLLPVPLTTIHQPCREIGQAAVAAMLDRIEQPEMLTRDILLDCSLMVRNSCGT